MFCIVICNEQITVCAKGNEKNILAEIHIRCKRKKQQPCCLCYFPLDQIDILLQFPA